MNWKTRQMFSDQEHGIVSGLSPINMMGGGSVPMPGYKDGGTVGRMAKIMGIQSTPISAQGAAMSGASPAILRSLGFEGATEAQQEEPSIEQQVAALAAQQGISVPEARATILNQMIQEKGVTLSEEVINQFATGVITLNEALAQAQAVGGGVGRAVGPGMGGGVGRAVGPGIPGMQDGGVAFTGMSFDEAYNLMQALTKDPTMSVSDADKAQMERAFFLGGEEHIFYQLAKGTNYQPSSQFKNIVKKSIPKMQDGGVALDLFEEGDEDINQALNMMSGSVSPPLSDIGPTAPTEIGEAVTMDQGPITETVEEISIEEEPSGYEIELQVLKRAFKDDIRSYVSEGGSGDLEEYLGKMSVVYGNQLDELKRKYGVTEYSPEEELITPDFMSELEALVSVPGFEPGGVNIFDETVIEDMDDATLQTALNNYFEGKQPVNAKLWRQTASEGRKVLAIRILGGGAGAGTGNDLAEALEALKNERKGIASKIGQATRGSYSSSLPRILHYGAAKSAGELAEAEAMDKTLADQTALLSRLSGGAGAPTSIMDSLTADQSNIITGASADKLKLQRLKGKQSAWTDILNSATETYGGTNAVMRALKNYILLYNYPPEGLFGATESDWEGTRMGADKQPITWEEYNTKYLKDIEDEDEYKTVLTAWLTLDKV